MRRACPGRAGRAAPRRGRRATVSTPSTLRDERLEAPRAASRPSFSTASGAERRRTRVVLVLVDAERDTGPLRGDDRRCPLPRHPAQREGSVARMATELTMDKIVSLSRRRASSSRPRRSTAGSPRRTTTATTASSSRRTSRRAGSRRWCRSATTSSLSTPRSSSTRGSGRRPGTSAASPTRSSTARPASSGSGPTTSPTGARGASLRAQAEQAPRRDRGVRPHRAAAVQPHVRDARRRGRGGGPDGVPPARDGAGDLRQLQERRSARATEAAVRDRPGRQVVPQRDHARELHLPHARVRADGDGVLRPAGRGGRVVPLLDRRAARLVPRATGSAREPSRPRARRRGAVALLERARATSSTCIRSAGRSSRESRTAGLRPDRPHGGVRHEARMGRRRSGDRYIPPSSSPPPA